MSARAIQLVIVCRVLSSSKVKARYQMEHGKTETTLLNRWFTHRLIVLLTSIKRARSTQNWHSSHIRDHGFICMRMLALLILCPIYVEVLLLLVVWICTDGGGIELTQMLIKGSKELDYVGGWRDCNPGEMQITMPPCSTHSTFMYWRRPR